jgi:chorismate synthase
MWLTGRIRLRETYARRFPVRTADKEAENKMIALIEECKKEGNTLGGIFEVVALGLPPGLGTHTQWDRKLDGRLAQALMSIQAIKGVEIGLGFEMARRRGSQVHDEIFFDPNKMVPRGRPDRRPASTEANNSATGRDDQRRALVPCRYEADLDAHGPL